MCLLQESDLEVICGGCRKKHNNNFSSTFDNHKMHSHYKTKECEHCGYTIEFQTTDSSGIRK